MASRLIQRAWLALRTVVGPCALLPLITGCPMDREEVLEKKYCDADGTCALGYRCRGGTCIADGREGKRALPLTQASDAATDAGVPPEERE